MLHLHNNTTQQYISQLQIYNEKISSWILHPEKETSHLQVNPEKISLKPTIDRTVYIDASRSESRVESAFCVMSGADVTYQWDSKIGNLSTVYQPSYS